MEWNVYSLFCFSLSQRQSLPIQKRGADQLFSPFSVLLLAVPEAVSSHTKVRSISSAGLSLCVGWGDIGCGGAAGLGGMESTALVKFAVQPTFPQVMRGEGGGDLCPYTVCSAH